MGSVTWASLTVEIHVELPRVGAVLLVALIVEDAGCFAVGFFHEIVLCLAAQAEGFSGASVVAIPRLSRAFTLLIYVIPRQLELLEFTFAETYSSKHHV